MTAPVLTIAMLLLAPANEGADKSPPPAAETMTPVVPGAAAESSDRFARETGNDWDDFRDFSKRPQPPGPGDDQPPRDSVRKELESEMAKRQPMLPTTDDATNAPEVTPPPMEMIDAVEPGVETIPAIQPLPAIGPGVVANHSHVASTSVPNDGLANVIRLTVDTSKRIDLPKPVDAAGITDPDVADLIAVTPQRLLLVGKAAGTTQLRLRTENDVTVHHVHVEPNTVVLQELIHSVSPSADIKVRSVKGKIVLVGRVSDVDDLARIEELATAYQGGPVMNHVTVAGVQQTLLRVIVAEVNKEASRSLGINWGLAGSNLSRDMFFANNLNQQNPTVVGSTGLANVLQGQLNYAVSPTAIGPQSNFTIGFPKAELQFFLNALRENSLGRTLAEPNLVAISGQTATFLAGGEVPIPVTQGGATAGAITIEYKEFGIRMAFTPTVLGGQLIRLHIMSEVSDAVPEAQQLNGLPVFSFRTRRVESTIECGNEQTFAMAGLLDDSIQAVSSKIPGLGDLPVLGTMFSSVDYQRSRSELVVLVTPELVSPMDPEMVPSVPGADITEPDDFELFMQQKLQGDAVLDETDAIEPAPDSYVRQARSPTIVASDIGIEGPWGMTGD